MGSTQPSPIMTPFKLIPSDLDSSYYTYQQWSFMRLLGCSVQRNFIRLYREDFVIDWKMGCFWRSFGGILWSGQLLFLNCSPCLFRCCRKTRLRLVGRRTSDVRRSSKSRGFRLVSDCLFILQCRWVLLSWSIRTGWVLLVLLAARWWVAQTCHPREGDSPAIASSRWQLFHWEVHPSSRHRTDNTIFLWSSCCRNRWYWWCCS